MIISKGTKCYIKNTVPSGNGLVGRTALNRAGRTSITWASWGWAPFSFHFRFATGVMWSTQTLTSCPSTYGMLPKSEAWLQPGPREAHKLQDRLPSRWATWRAHSEAIISQSGAGQTWGVDGTVILLLFLQVSLPFTRIPDWLEYEYKQNEWQAF